MSIQSHGFQPILNASQLQTGTIPTANYTFTAGGNVLKLTNATISNNTGAYIRVGKVAQTATTDDLFLGSGETAFISIAPDDDNIAILAATATDVSVAVTPGYGGRR